MKYNIGHSFTGLNGERLTITGTENEEFYLVSNGAKYYYASLESILDNQEEVIYRAEHREELETAYQARIAAREAAEQKAREERAEAAKLYGYADTMHGVKLERVRSTLLKQFNYGGKIETRAEHMKEALKSGLTLDIRDRNGKTEYRLTDKHLNLCWTITKTEYDFAVWLTEQKGA